MDAAALKSILAGLPFPTLVIGSDGRITALNVPAARIFGTGLEGRLYVAVLRQPAIIDAVDTALRERRQVQGRLQISGPSADTVFRVLATPLDDGEVIVALEDISDVEQSSRIRRDFVANVSHELRTPLTALLGFIETLQGAAKDDPVARERFLSIMSREAERMNRLVADLMSLTRVEEEERVRPTAQVDVANIAGSVVLSLRHLADDARVKLSLTGDVGPLSVRADPDQITQVVTNLVENGLKYGNAGGEVRINLTRLERDPALRGPAVRIDVIDSGEGIDEVHIPRLTERFYRVDSHRSREKGGTGLGLAIVKHIVNRHRGRLKIESEKGKGSVFSVILPQA